MGDTHFRSNIRQQEDNTLTIDFNTGSFANAVITSGYITTFTSNSVTATTLTAGSIQMNLLASSALSGTAKVMTIKTTAATPYYCKVYPTKA